MDWEAGTGETDRDTCFGGAATVLSQYIRGVNQRCSQYIVINLDPKESPKLDETLKINKNKEVGDNNY